MTAKKDTMPQVSRFWNTAAEDFDAIYTGKNKSVFGRVLDRVFRRDMYQRFDWVMRMAGDVRGKSICDIGCGSGRFMVQFARNGARRVVGVDIAPRMLQLARELAAAQGVRDTCEFVNADVLDWKTSERFDIVVGIGFWDYIAEPAGRLRVIRGLTGERFLSAWPRFWTWRMPVRKIRLGMSGCPVYFFRCGDVYRHLEGAGFRVVSCQTVGKLFCVDAVPR